MTAGAHVTTERAVDEVVLVVLAKAPVPGRAKTRLTPPYTRHQAAGLAAASLLDTLDAVRAAHALIGGPPPVLAWTGDVDAGAAAPAIRAALAEWVVVDQRGETLGERIAAAHRDAAERSGVRATLQIGTDTPQLDAAALAAAVATLRTAGTRSVLGPATDGGWWALGLREANLAAVVVDVATSTPRTGADTRDALTAAGATPTLLPELTDVDDAGSCARVAALVPGTRFGRLARSLAAVTAA